MSRKKNLYSYRLAVWLSAVAILIAPFTAFAQTDINAPSNKYSVSDDVKLGRQAAAEVERQLPLLPENGPVDNYVESVGANLLNGVPSEFRHPGFDYQFNVVNARDINAFALPGGFMYVNRGLINAARSEGELAGVMAHEMAHVALRHGTAQASKAQSLKYQLPSIGGQILGAIIGGGLGSVIAQGTQFGLSVHFLNYSREYERQADILGAQIMARSGYDPLDLANMFRTIEREGGGSGGPEWLSSHPNPGNRYERIQEEARLLRVSPYRATQNSTEFNRIQALLRDMGPAPTMEEIARSGKRTSSSRQYPEDSRLEQRVQLPSSSYRTYTGGNLFRVSVPDNWREFSDSNSVTFAPQGAYGNYQGQPVFTHGAVVGVVRTGSNDLRQASDQYISALLQSNPYLNAQSNYRRGSIDGRSALSMTLSGVSNVTRRSEIVTVYTTMLRNGDLFYLITVTPRDDSGQFNRAFQNIIRSVNLNA
ncbi:MAG TPA: M48 family metallopeptidase [Blastocatellia bacterium]|nr:M48 family metallopeptidase [Blastocatellia bacterium]